MARNSRMVSLNLRCGTGGISQGFCSHREQLLQLLAAVQASDGIGVADQHHNARVRQPEVLETTLS
jgi:hypothetical protein